jgi:hypothetical protein
VRRPLASNVSPGGLIVDASSRRAVWAAGFSAGLAIAFQTAGKATRDAIFLSAFPVTALPAMMVAAAGASVLLAVASAWALTRAGPRRLVPGGFALSAALLLVEWWLVGRTARVGAVLVYLHYAAFGAVLVSGFWSVVSERFDPRTARRQVSGIGAAGTLGGVLGGLMAAQAGAVVTVPLMLPALAACHVAAGAFVFAVGKGIRGAPRTAGAEPGPRQVAARVPYLRVLLVLVLLTTMAEVLIDYVFKLRVTETVGQGEALLRFFAWFYTGTGLLAFATQILVSRRALRTLGLARIVSALPVTAMVGSGTALAVGGLAPILAARGGESVARSSLYRTGYELLFAPLLPGDKRASKALLDVGVTRVGDVAGAVVVRLTLISPAAAQLLLILAVVVSGVAAALTVRLQRGYASALERVLASRAGTLDRFTMEHGALQSALIHTVGGAGDLLTDLGGGEADGRPAAWRPSAAVPAPAPPADRAAALRATDPLLVRRALEEGELTPEIAGDAIRLLAWDAVAPAAVDALRKVASPLADRLVAALRDPTEEFTVRRRLPIVLAAAPTQAAADGLLAGLRDQRFEVRYRSGLALHRILRANPALLIDREQASEAVLREVSVDRRVWESHRLLDQHEDEEWSPMFDAMLRQRADRALQHVFTVLALILPRRPLQLAYRGLFASDPQVRGTALEYLETALPDAIRRALWPFLEDTRKGPPTQRSRDAIVRDLMASEATIALDLERLRRPSAPGDPAQRRRGVAEDQSPGAIPTEK